LPSLPFAGSYDIVQLDLTNAYLHASIVDVVYIYVPEGFPGQGEIARLRKAAYGAKQGARRFYDNTANVLQHIGMKQCPIESCLFRYLHNDNKCFLIQYVDNSLIAGHPQAINHLKQKMRKYFKCKFIQPKDFLGLDLTITKPGLISLAMHTFTSKMIDTLSIRADHPGDVLSPGRTDKKVVRGEEPEPNDQYRSKVGNKSQLAYHGYPLRCRLHDKGIVACSLRTYQK
jgi:hypothetical protein